MLARFFPKNSGIPIRICNHRFGADMTFSQCTDTVNFASAQVAEALSFKYNLRLGAFHSTIYGDNGLDIKACEDTGQLRFDVYFETDKWVKPSTNVVVSIPDYEAVNWSAAASPYFGVTVGGSKLTRTPNHGQEFFDLSAGNYGADLINGIIGNSNLRETLDLIEIQKAQLKDIISRTPSSTAYRNGKDNAALPLLSEVIGGRNSNYGGQDLDAGFGNLNTSIDADTFYGNDKNGTGFLGYKDGALVGREYFQSYMSTSRYWDSINLGTNGQAAVDAYILDQLTKTKANHGWYRDFAHWHSAYNNNSFSVVEHFLNLIRTNLNDVFAWSCSNGEALEYMMLRELTERVIGYEKDGLIYIIADVRDKYKGARIKGIPADVPMNCLNTPLSVEVDLSGSALSGKVIESAYGKILKTGTNKYIIEIPFKSNSDAICMNVLRESEVDRYLNLKVPDISYEVSGNVITVYCSRRCRIVIFESVDTIYHATVFKRLNVLSAKHEFTYTGTNNIWVGAISEDLQSQLIQIQ